MAVTFPLSVTVFQDTLKVVSVKWSLSEFVITSGVTAGQIVTSEVASPKWSAEIALAPSYHDDARKVRAMLRRIGAANPFYLYNPAAPYPRMDPDGSALGSATVTIASISGRQMSLTGLPAGYQLKWGDLFSVDYGTAPVRRALFEVNEDITANGAGTTGNFEVTPPPKTGVVAGLAVTLKKPSCKMRLLSHDAGITEPMIASGITLQAMETV
ncbi:MAG TPA: hypothetical protein PKA33_01745 [Amaricoccus sp.]|uniref:hypothetical protein n=1 Tax=Amaricoccus sp. TaxID=1872485 RepID=UPI002C5234DF|nr:hypothetical protein [Amaricoccus sp.]HMR51182.1 hypothetical protein [Amaricoccus sp.]HMT98070.1 hypothetical protein [Amaricoccus sp.]